MNRKGLLKKGLELIDDKKSDTHTFDVTFCRYLQITINILHHLLSIDIIRLLTKV